MPKILIAYYSRTGENYVSGQLKMLKKGNTEVVAEKIAALTGGELFKIEQVKPYATGYNDCIEQACTDQRSNARPAITSTLADPERYDVIYLGYPNYWGTMPMAVYTFMESYDFTGKKIHPELIKSLAEIKKAAAITNRNSGRLSHKIANAIIQSCDEIIEGKLREEFIVDPIQGGAGTSTNMNANEVIANRAIEILNGEKGDYSIVHTNDHVNMAQSTNDV